MSDPTAEEPSPDRDQDATAEFTGPSHSSNGSAGQFVCDPDGRPAQIGEFRVVDVLGEGGMSVVYLAKQDKPDREVALKLMREGLHSPAARRRFEHEVEVLGEMALRTVRVAIAKQTVGGHQAMVPDPSANAAGRIYSNALMTTTGTH